MAKKKRQKTTKQSFLFTSKKAHLEIFTGVANADRQAWKERVEEFVADRQDIIYLVPTHLKRQKVQGQLLRTGAPVWQGTPVRTLSGFLEEAGQEILARSARAREPLTRLAQQILLETIIDDHQSRRKKSTLPGLARRFSVLVSEIKEAMVEDLERPLAGFIERLKNLKLPADDFRSEILMAYEEALFEFNLMDADDNLVLLAERLSQDPGYLAPILQGRKKLILDGFYYLAPLQKMFLEQMILAVEETLAYIPITQQLAPQRKEAFSLSQNTLEFFHSVDNCHGKYLNLVQHEESRDNTESLARLFTPQASQGEKITSPEFELVQADSRLKEVEFIALEVQKLIHSGIDPSQILVSFPQFSSYQLILDEIFPLYQIPYAMGVGGTLDQNPLVQTILRFLSLPLQNFHREEVLDALSSPYVAVKAEIKGEPVRLRLPLIEEITRFARIAGHGIREWESRLDQAQEQWDYEKHSFLDEVIFQRQKEALLQLFRAIPVPNQQFDIQELTKKTELLLDKLGLEWKLAEEGLLSLRPEIIRRDRRALDKFRESLVQISWTLQKLNRRKLTGEQYVLLLRRLLGGVFLPGPSGDQQSVPVVGLLDTRGLDFSHVFVGGFLESEFPRYPEYDILLTKYEREKLKFPSPALRSIEEEKLIFNLLIQSTRKKVYLTMPIAEGANPMLPSPFLFNLREVADVPERRFESPTLYPKSHGPSLGANYLEDCHIGGLVARGETTAKKVAKEVGQRYHLREEAQSLIHSIRVSCHREDSRELGPYQGILESEFLRQRLADRFFYGRRIFSTSQLETYAKCPYKFFHERVLHLKEVEDIEEDITAMERGNLIHNLLYDFYTDWRDKYPGEKVTEENRDQAEKLLLEKAKATFDHPDYIFLGGVSWDLYKEKLIRGLTSTDPDNTGILREFLLKEVKSKSLPRFFEWQFGEFSYGDEEGIDEASVEANLVLPPEDVELGYSLIAHDVPSIQVRGKVDRIDIQDVADTGGLHKEYFVEVCDYKTGQPPSASFVDKGVSFQLPIYILAVNYLLKVDDSHYTAREGGYYQLSHPSKISKRLTIKKKHTQTKVDVALVHLAEDLKAMELGYFPTTVNYKDPDPRGYCTICPAQKVCSPNVSHTLSIRDKDQRDILRRKAYVIEWMNTRK